MTKEEYESRRDALLHEVRKESKRLRDKAKAEGRHPGGIGSDLPEVKRIKEEYRLKAVALRKEYEKG